MFQSFEDNANFVFFVTSLLDADGLNFDVDSGTVVWPHRVGFFQSQVCLTLSPGCRASLARLPWATPLPTPSCSFDDRSSFNYWHQTIID